MYSPEVVRDQRFSVIPTSYWGTPMTSEARPWTFALPAAGATVILDATRRYRAHGLYLHGYRSRAVADGPERSAGA